MRFDDDEDTLPFFVWMEKNAQNARLPDSRSIEGKIEWDFPFFSNFDSFFLIRQFFWATC